ncbi:putative prophage LambdaBa01 positive control factor Xpf [Anoxybacillus flavithermus]|nr:putative prophage LambdaBa01 positive control factor Xpf [Anoxybacillus flavithermus]
MDELLQEYKQTLKQTKKLLEHAPEQDKTIIRQMIADLEFVIEWLTTGRQPGHKRGIERRAAY